MQVIKKIYDECNVRYQMVKSNPGSEHFNWLFLPGGPGADSIYFLDLIEQLTMPGDYWLIDFPENGTNFLKTYSADYDFKKWDACLLSSVHQFDKPILVGHSFGGMFPLLFPELEDILTGCILMNSAPSLWVEEAADLAKEQNFPSFSEPMAAFEKNPNSQTFTTAWLACAPYYFTEKYLEKGKTLLAQIPFNYHASEWWLNKASQTNFNATWIPQSVKTLIIGASDDFVTPLSIFERDHRFNRENISLHKIDNAGHFPWIEQPNITCRLFNDFFEYLTR